jgi:GNAT superfamily N-acetyltransferase
MSLHIRAAEQEDAAVVALLGRITFAETFGPLFEHHPDDLALYLQATFGVAKIRRSLDVPGNSYWLAFADDLPVGYAKLKYPSATGLLPESDAAQLQKIYVLRDFLGRGIGLPLLQVSVARARRLGHRRSGCPCFARTSGRSGSIASTALRRSDRTSSQSARKPSISRRWCGPSRSPQPPARPSACR